MSPTTSPTHEQRLSRACAFSFCEGLLTMKLVAIGRWRLTSDFFPTVYMGAYTDVGGFDDVWARAERIERETGFLLPARVVVRRCEEAVKAAGWRAEGDDRKDARLTYRPDPHTVTGKWVSIATGFDDWSTVELRKMATDAALRCRAFGVPVDVETPDVHIAYVGGQQTECGLERGGHGVETTFNPAMATCPGCRAGWRGWPGGKA